MNIATFDPELADAITQEGQRQLNKLELIASENIVSPRVLEATGSILTNKYAEGYPAKRYYGGCEYVDISENLAIERAKSLFGSNFANVQPHSGSQANMAVYLSVIEAGDTIVGMDLSHGGHLTHGSPVNFSGLLFNVAHYGVKESDQLIDYDHVLKVAQESRPKLIVAGASAYPRVIDFAKFRAIADEVGAYLLVDMAHIAGLVAGGHHPSPVPHAHFVTTTTHKTLRGPRGGLILTQDEKLAKKVNSRIFPGIQGGPFCHIIAAKALALKEADSEAFKRYSAQVIQNAKALARQLQTRGYQLTTGGTDNHLMLIDLRKTEITGKDAEMTLDRCNITVNKNTVPFETRSPFVTTGIRIGTPALTSRGLQEIDMRQVADFIHRALSHRGNEPRLKSIAQEVKDFSAAFPEFEDTHVAY